MPVARAVGCFPCTGLFSCQYLDLHHAEIDWENIRKQTAPKFVPVKKNTAEEDAVDWELTSLTNQHFGHAFGDSSGGHAAVHAAASQDNGSGNDANANAFMAAVAMHAIVSAENQSHGEW